MTKGRIRHRLSSIDKLPVELRQRLDTAIAERSKTVDQLLHMLKDAGATRISRAALGRYKLREERASTRAPGKAIAVLSQYLRLPETERARFWSALKALHGGAT